jgi:hypothetical protein
MPIFMRRKYMNTQIRAASLRNQLQEAGVVIPASDCFFIGDDTVLGKIPEGVEYRVDQHDKELGLIQIVFLVLEEAEYEDL